MPKEYPEVVEYIRIPGSPQLILVPAAEDLEERRENLRQIEAELALVYDPEHARPDIPNLEKAIAAEALKGPALDAALKGVADYRAEQRGRHALLEAQKRREEIGLKRLEAGAGIVGGEVVREAYWFQRFSRGTRMRIEEDATAIDAAAEKRTVDTEKRNRELLESVLKGRSATPDPNDPREAIPDPYNDLDEAVYELLLRRMWLRNSMSAELLSFFRGCRGEPGRN